MAGSLLVGRLSILEKRLVTQFTSTTTPNSALLTWKRKVHSSVYDKNQDEHIHPSLIPEELIHQGDYWAPHPKTGVFGPISNHNRLASDIVPIGTGTKESVLEVKAFFRSFEDLDKPLYYF